MSTIGVRNRMTRIGDLISIKNRARMMIFSKRGINDEQLGDTSTTSST